MKKYNWATLGCGVIANELAAAMEKKGEKLYSVANRTHEKAVQFAEKYGPEGDSLTKRLMKNTGLKKFMIILIRFLKTKM